MKIEFYHVDAFEVANYEPIWRELCAGGVEANLVAVPDERNTADAGWFDFDRFQAYCEAKQLPYTTQSDPAATLGVTTQNANILRDYPLRARLMYGPVMYPAAWAFQAHAVKPFDAVLVHGQAYADRFAPWLRRTQLPIIGYPRYDDFFAGKLSREAIRQRWGVDQSRPVLAFMPTWGDNTGFDVFFPALLALSKQYQIILRPHHCTLRLEPQRLALLQASGLLILDSAFELSEIYCGADIVLSDVRSGSLFEACLCNVPTVGMVLSPAEQSGWLTQYGITEMVGLCDAPEKLEAALEIALQSTAHVAARAQWAEQHVAHRDGTAAKHAAEALVQLASPMSARIVVPRIFTRKVSVVLPTYNHLDYLPQAIAGLLGQTFTDFELIIVNDGSTDATEAYLATLKDPRIQVINQANGGLPAALNRGFEGANGEYRTWTSADNVTGPTWLEQLVKGLDAAPETVGFAYSGFAWIDAQSNILGVHRGQKVQLDHLLVKNPGIASFLYRTTVADEVGVYDVSLTGAEDWDMWIRILEVSDARYVDDVLYYYRLHGNSMTSSIPDKVAQASQDTLFKLHARHGNTFDLDVFYPRLRFSTHATTAYWQARSRLGALLVESPFCPVAWTSDLLVDALLEKYSPEVLLNLLMLLCRHGQWAQALNTLDEFREHYPSPQLDELRGLLGKGDPRILEQLSISHTPDNELLFSLGRVDAPPIAAVRPQSISHATAIAALPTLAANEADAPLFTVVMPTHNRPDLLTSAIQSVLAQTCQDFELIVVNDAGCDVASIVHWLNENGQITYVRHAKNRGLSGARNTALRLARGRYIVYLDDDDLMLPMHLSVLQQQFTRTPDAVVYTDSDTVFEALQAGKRVEMQRGNPYAHQEFSKERMQVSNYLPVNTWSHPRMLLAKTGEFDVSLPSLEDWDLLLRMIQHAEFVHVRQTTIEVRHRPGNVADNMSRREKPKFVGLFEKLYARYPASPMVEAERKRNLQGGASTSTDAKAEANQHYRLWLSRHQIREVDAEVMAERMLTKWQAQPVFNVIMPFAQGQQALLAQTMASLDLQFYKQWRLIVIADIPAPDEIFNQTDILGWLEIEDITRPELVFAAVNGVVAEIAADWTLVLNPGTTFAEHAFVMMGDYADRNPLWQALYTDHDEITLQGNRQTPWFKPDFNLDWFSGFDYIGQALAFRSEAILTMGGFHPYPGASLFDLILRIFDSAGAVAIGHIAEVLLQLPAAQGSHPDSDAAHQVALEAHLSRIGQLAEVTAGVQPHTFRLVYACAEQPLVSIVIPNKDCLEYLEPCLNTLWAKTQYPNFEVIVVDNDSEDSDTFAFYRDQASRYGERFKVVEFPEPFNFAAQCNVGTAAARGEYILFLNNDTEIVQAEWLTRLLQHAQRPEVGIVGARLLYPERGTIQHAGILLGAEPSVLAVATHLYTQLDVHAPGYLNRLQVDMNPAAVTGACLMIRRSVFDAVGGMNAEHLAVLFNDVDLCLKVREQGYLIVYTPYATVVHHGGASLKPVTQSNVQAIAESSARGLLERTYMFKRWMPQLANDPAYNRHLSLNGNQMELENVALQNWDVAFHDRPRILANPVRGGSGQYRVKQPFEALQRAGKAQAEYIYPLEQGIKLPSVVELARLAPDSFLVQNAFSDQEREALGYYKAYLPGMFRVCALDDLVAAIPEQSSVYAHFKRHYRDAKPRLKKTLALCDRLIVTTAPLIEYCKDMIDDIILVPNTLPKTIWGELKSRRHVGKKPRVGWVGAQQHLGDLKLIESVVKATANEVDWIFMGMWPPELDQYIREKHDFLDFEKYPEKMASLNLDLALAPLEINAFNEAKSNLRLLEYGALGWPVICTDITPYQTDNPPVLRLPNVPEQWIAAIRERIADLPALAKEGDQLRAWVESRYWLEDHVDLWLHALTR